MKMKRVNFTITERHNGYLRSLSDRTGLTKSDILRRAIEEYAHKYLSKMHIREEIQRNKIEEE